MTTLRVGRPCREMIIKVYLYVCDLVTLLLSEHSLLYSYIYTVARRDCVDEDNDINIVLL